MAMPPRPPDESHPYLAPSYVQPSYPAYAQLPRTRPAKVWDIVVTIVLLVLSVGLALLVSFFGLFLVMASDPCGARTCSTELIGLGVLVAVGLPWVVLVAGVVVAIVLLVKRRLAFWIPLVMAPLIVASWFVGAAIASAGVPTS